ncbi:hypothetical protein C8F04DRAFT_1181437 [Mycena alexandri]|uniref:PhoD-like phosphatase metallophosphatase domain-containing protein n=1 Tax=Mycena alexandri TaxID=1745969 RepID=A0AAD6SYI2_9AGAR|nr:hypothetical protein C8F04DRAFT_1181437 [Mycena alexandri]
MSANVLGSLSLATARTMIGLKLLCYLTKGVHKGSQPSVLPGTRTLRDLPWIHIFDDHEFINDYHPGIAGGEDIYTSAMSPFEDYQGAANPPRPDKDRRKKIHPVSTRIRVVLRVGYKNLWSHTASKGGWRIRSPVDVGCRAVAGAFGVDHERKGMESYCFGGADDTGENWSEGNDEMDSWAGYLEERQVIFEALWRVGGGVIISGDRHEHEFSTSPLSFFYPPFLREYVSHDETIFNLPQGASKFGQLTFDSSDEKTWIVGFELVVTAKGLTLQP